MAKNATRKPSDALVGDATPNPAQPADVGVPAADASTGAANPPAPAGSRKVRVVAREPIAELIDGEICRFAKGETFVLEEDRARAIGPLVEILIPITT